MWRLSDQFRTEIFKAFADSNQPGLIFTYVWAFDRKKDWEFVDRVFQIFEENGAEIYFVELEADVNERLKRNKSPNRLQQKPTKRNIEWSEMELLEIMKRHRLNSDDGEITRENYIRINNTDLEPDEVARIISERFHFY